MMRILLADDNESITKMMSKYLTAKGYDCTVSNDGRNKTTLLPQKTCKIKNHSKTMGGMSKN